MTFKKADWVFLAAVGVVIAGVSLLPSPREQNPTVPADGEHRAAVMESDCRQCHTVGGTRPLRIPPHPKRTDCLRCHARTAG